ncbi:MAG: PKD domain-containing protein [Candidatus Gracilibacteria bacterium]|nr:PKD domain-containing protein [Candidatus Gracilibacteria bacterium]
MKLLLNISFFFLTLFCINQLSATYIPIENIFSDITKDYKYFDELQELYNRQAIYPDSDGKFNPYKLLTRDEFVSIALEVSCKKCTKPNTPVEVIKKYGNSVPYFDVSLSSKYSYCIAMADDQNYVKGYLPGDKCDDGSYENGKSPFCPNNYILLEEAIAVILRNSKIFTIEDNNTVIQNIENGTITDVLSTDVSPLNSDGSVYTFYGYLQKALNYSIVEYDNLGNKIEYKLLELNNGKIYPKKRITKEEFLKMAYIALKTNSCKYDFTNNLSLKMDILDSSCTGYDENCSLADLTEKQRIYDFKGIVGGVSENGIDEEKGYIWRFYNDQTGEETIKYGKYIDNYNFLTDGTWTVYLVIIDNDGNSGEVYNTLTIKGDTISNNTVNSHTGIIDYNSLNVSIDADPIEGTGPLSVLFNGVVGLGDGDYSYEWNFGGTDISYGKNVQHVFGDVGIYNVLLTVIDSSGKTGVANILINVTEIDGCETKDADSDGVNDCDDLCQLVIGSSLNKGCPVVTKCDSNCLCPKGETCSVSSKPVCSIKGVCLKDSTVDDSTSLGSCVNSFGSSFIYGNVVCNTCPCSNFVDFIAKIRRCDLLFPSITSPDSSEIYSAGSTYEFK